MHHARLPKTIGDVALNDPGGSFPGVVDFSQEPCDILAPVGSHVNAR